MLEDFDQNLFKHFPYPVCLSTEDTMTEKAATTASSCNSSQFNFDTFSSPVTPKSKPCTSNLQSACRLTLTTHRLYSQEMALPEGVEAISITPSAGEGTMRTHTNYISLSAPLTRAFLHITKRNTDGSIRISIIVFVLIIVPLDSLVIKQLKHN